MTWLLALLLGILLSVSALAPRPHYRLQRRALSVWTPTSSEKTAPCGRRAAHALRSAGRRVSSSAGIRDMLVGFHPFALIR